MFRNWVLILVLVFLALQFLILKTAQAEYRVYRLGVKYDQTQPEQEVLTTLDDIQYMTYYKVTPTQTTYIKKHWMCPGRTDGFKNYCTEPVTPSPAKIQKLAAQLQTANPQVQSPASPRQPANSPQQSAPIMLQ